MFLQGHSGVCVCVTIVEVKQEAAHVFVVNLPSAISFILRDDLENQGNNDETVGTNQKAVCGRPLPPLRSTPR